MDFGMKNRLSRIIKPKTGKTVMLAVDHGYFQGPTTGLKDLKKTVAPFIASCGLSLHNKRDAANKH